MKWPDRRSTTYRASHVLTLRDKFHGSRGHPGEASAYISFAGRRQRLELTASSRIYLTYVSKQDILDTYIRAGMVPYVARTS